MMAHLPSEIEIHCTLARTAPTSTSYRKSYPMGQKVIRPLLDLTRLIHADFLNDMEMIRYHVELGK